MTDSARRRPKLTNAVIESLAVIAAQTTITPANRDGLTWIKRMVQHAQTDDFRNRRAKLREREAARYLLQ